MTQTSGTPQSSRPSDFYSNEARQRFGLWLRNAPSDITEAERFAIIEARVKEREASLPELPGHRGRTVQERDRIDAACYKRCQVKAERGLLEWFRAQMPEHTAEVREAV